MNKTKQQLVDEIAELKRRVHELESALSERAGKPETPPAQQRLKDILDHAPAVIYLKDTRNRYLLINRRFEELFKVSRSQVVGLTDHDIFPAQTADAFQANDQQVLRTGSPIAVEEVAPHDDGPHIYMSQKYPLRDAEGRVYGVCGISSDVTDRIRMEKALEESEYRARAVFDQTFQFIGLMKTDGTLIEANRSALKFAGVDAAEVLGKPFWETPWWKHSQRLQNQLRQAVQEAANGRFVRFEATHTAPDGALAYIDFSLKPLKDETGKVILLIPEGRDITDLKRTEEALRASENTAQALLNAPSDSAILIDPNGEVRAINSVAAHRFGRSVDELVGRNLYDFMPPDIARYRKWRVEQMTAGKAPLRFEDERKGRFYDTTLYPIWDAQGNLSLIAIYARDVTNYKRALERIRERTADLIESEEKYRTLVENVPLVVYRLDPRGDILLVNHFVEEMFGYAPTELFQNPTLWRRRVYEEDRDRVDSLFEQSFAEGKECVAEYRVRHKDGHLVYVMDHFIPFRGNEGRPNSVDGIIMDVTARVELQKKLVRARELKTISEVSSRLAHEIRNPLVSAGGFARRLLTSMDYDDPNRAKMEIIVKEVSRLEDILRMILNYIQPLEISKAETSINELITEALAEVDGQIREHGSRVDLRLTPDLPPIPLDRDLMRRALAALLRNALNQTQPNSTLCLSSGKEDNSITITIGYDAPHLSKDDIEHFFYPFTTSPNAYENKFLPMSKVLVDKHGGVINVRRRDSFITISLSLPL